MPTNFYDKTVIADYYNTRSGYGIQSQSPPWIQVVSVQNVAVTKSINAVLGLGESSAIALALETQNPLIILDDKRARAYAKNLGLDHTGVIGLLRLGYKKGIIKDIDILLADLKNDCFYLPNNVEELIKE